jgi:hypothetical protein
MVRIIVNNLEDISRVQVKLRAIKSLLPRMQEVATERAAEDILDEIHAKMKQNNFSKKIITATFVGKTEKRGSLIRQHFISNYEADSGFDVSNAREEGTTHPNPTFPKKKGGVLRWVAKGGEIIFRKKSHPKGIERLLIIEKTLATSKEKFKNKIADNLAESIQKVLGV